MHHELGAGGYNSNPFFGQSFLSNLFGKYAGTRINYQQEVGDLTQSRLIMAAVNYLGRALPEARLEVVQSKADGTNKKIPDHPLVKLFKRPNKFYAGELFFKSLGLSWIISGNVYFYKVRNMLGEPFELWYLPHHLVEPRWESPSSFIDYYAYQVDGVEHKFKPEDVIHLRNGIDPNNTRMGLSDIASALREVYTDNESANFSALLMRNCGVGPFVISPKKDITTLEKKDRDKIQDSFQRTTTGDNRGKPIVNSVAVEVTKTGFSPKDMELSALRRVPEETIASLTGISAMALGFGAGLDHSTYSNMEEARTGAYEDVIVPLWRYIEAELDAQLLPDFDKSGKLETRFDLSNVRALQEDENKLFTRLGTAYRTGFMKRSEARSKANLTVTPEDEVYFCEPKKAEDNPTDETGKTENVNGK